VIRHYNSQVCDKLKIIYYYTLKEESLLLYFFELHCAAQTAPSMQKHVRIIWCFTKYFFLAPTECYIFSGLIIIWKKKILHLINKALMDSRKKVFSNVHNFSHCTKLQNENLSCRYIWWRKFYPLSCSLLHVLHSASIEMTAISPRIVNI